MKGFAVKMLANLSKVWLKLYKNILCNWVQNLVMWKCVEELESFYETIGFTEIHEATKWLQFQEVIDHYDLIKAQVYSRLVF